eukprot:g4316.t1
MPKKKKKGGKKKKNKKSKDDDNLTEAEKEAARIEQDLKVNEWKTKGFVRYIPPVEKPKPKPKQKPLDEMTAFERVLARKTFLPLPRFSSNCRDAAAQTITWTALAEHTANLPEDKQLLKLRHFGLKERKFDDGHYHPAASMVRAKTRRLHTGITNEKKRQLESERGVHLHPIERKVIPEKKNRTKQNLQNQISPAPSLEHEVFLSPRDSYLHRCRMVGVAPRPSIFGDVSTMSKSTLKNGKKLTYQNAELGSGQITALCGAIDEVKHMHMHTLGLANNRIDQLGCRVLGHALQQHHSLRHLDLSRNNLGPKGMSYLIPVVENNRLRSVNFASCSLTDKAIASFCRTACEVGSLRQINISGNECGLDGCAALANFIASSKMKGRLRLMEVIASHNKMPPGGICKVLHALEENETMQVLDISYNSLSGRKPRQYGKLLPALDIDAYRKVPQERGYGPVWDDIPASLEALLVENESRNVKSTKKEKEKGKKKDKKKEDGDVDEETLQAEAERKRQLMHERTNGPFAHVYTPNKIDSIAAKAKQEGNEEKFSQAKAKNGSKDGWVVWSAVPVLAQSLQKNTTLQVLRISHCSIGGSPHDYASLSYGLQGNTGLHSVHITGNQIIVESDGTVAPFQDHASLSSLHVDRREYLKVACRFSDLPDLPCFSPRIHSRRWFTLSDCFITDAWRHHTFHYIPTLSGPAPTMLDKKKGKGNKNQNGNEKPGNFGEEGIQVRAWDGEGWEEILNLRKQVKGEVTVEDLLRAKENQAASLIQKYAFWQNALHYRRWLRFSRMGGNDFDKEWEIRREINRHNSEEERRKEEMLQIEAEKRNSKKVRSISKSKENTPKMKRKHFIDVDNHEGQETTFDDELLRNEAEILWKTRIMEKVIQDEEERLNFYLRFNGGLRRTRGLSRAALEGDVACVVRLLMLGCDVNEVNENHDTPLIFACGGGLSPSKENLQDQNLPNPPTSIDIEKCFTKTSFSNNSNFNEEKSVDRSKRGDPNPAICPIYEIVKLLVDAGAYINHQNKFGNTALHFAYGEIEEKSNFGATSKPGNAGFGQPLLVPSIYLRFKGAKDILNKAMKKPNTNYGSIFHGKVNDASEKLKNGTLRCAMWHLYDPSWNEEERLQEEANLIQSFYKQITGIIATGKERRKQVEALEAKRSKLPEAFVAPTMLPRRRIEMIYQVYGHGELAAKDQKQNWGIVPPIHELPPTPREVANVEIDEEKQKILNEKEKLFSEKDEEYRKLRKEDESKWNERKEVEFVVDGRIECVITTPSQDKSVGPFGRRVWHTAIITAIHKGKGQKFYDVKFVELAGKSLQKVSSKNLRPHFREGDEVEVRCNCTEKQLLNAGLVLEDGSMELNYANKPNIPGWSRCTVLSIDEDGLNYTIRDHWGWEGRTQPKFMRRYIPPPPGRFPFSNDLYPVTMKPELEFEDRPRPKRHSSRPFTSYEIRHLPKHAYPISEEEAQWKGSIGENFGNSSGEEVEDKNEVKQKRNVERKESEIVHGGLPPLNLRDVQRQRGKAEARRAITANRKTKGITALDQNAHLSIVNTLLQEGREKSLRMNVGVPLKQSGNLQKNGIKRPSIYSKKNLYPTHPLECKYGNDDGWLWTRRESRHFFRPLPFPDAEERLPNWKWLANQLSQLGLWHDYLHRLKHCVSSETSHDDLFVSLHDMHWLLESRSRIQLLWEEAVCEFGVEKNDRDVSTSYDIGEKNIEKTDNRNLDIDIRGLKLYSYLKRYRGLSVEKFDKSASSNPWKRRLKKTESKDLFDASKVILSAFHVDWSEVNCPRILGKDTKKNDIKRIYDILKSNYEDIVELFTYHCSMSKGCGVLAWIPFSEIATSFGMHHPEYLQQKDVDLIFQLANLESNPTAEEIQAKQEMAMKRRVFAIFDKDGSGEISAEEMHFALKGLGLDCSEDNVSALIKEADKDMNGSINFEEFGVIAKKYSAAIDRKIKHLDAHKSVLDKKLRSKANPDRGLVRYEFLSTLVMLALKRYYADGSGNKGLCKSPSDAVRKFFKSNFQQAILMKQKEALAHGVTLNRNELRKNIIMHSGPAYLGHKILRSLKHLFMLFCESDDKAPVLASKFCMKFRAFRDMLKASGLMDVMCHESAHTNEMHGAYGHHHHSSGNVKTKSKTDEVKNKVEDEGDDETLALNNDSDSGESESDLGRALSLGLMRVGSSGPNGRFSEKTIRLCFNQSRMIQKDPIHPHATPKLDEITFEDFVEAIFRIAHISSHEEDKRKLCLKAYELYVDFLSPLVRKKLKGGSERTFS